ncbi:MAG TPA: hypothetical protein VKU02_17245, partial [Gemmataceae bacterium]|nr:hypothetical protein [Gemmataceae bacterium]
MNRKREKGKRNVSAWPFACCLLPFAFCLVLGCAHPQTRLQADEEADRDKQGEVKTIGDVSVVANAEAIPVSGIGLVIGLDDTGGGAPPGPYRQRLEEELRKRRV